MKHPKEDRDVYYETDLAAHKAVLQATNAQKASLPESAQALSINR